MGTGRVSREETLKVRIPPGVEDGTALRIAGHGLPAEKPGAPPGDLFVVIRAAKDSRFERRGMLRSSSGGASVQDRRKT